MGSRAGRGGCSARRTSERSPRQGSLSGQAGFQLSHILARNRIAPIRYDRACRGKYEVALTKAWMRDNKLAAAPHTAAPKHDIEVEYPVPPAPGSPSPKLALEPLEAREHRLGIILALDQRSGVGKTAPRCAHRSRRDDRRARSDRAERRQFLHRCAHHALRQAVEVVPAIRSQRDEESAAQVICLRCLRRCGRKAAGGGRGKSPCQPGAWRLVRGQA